MQKADIILHMNENHADILVKFYNKYTIQNVTNAELIDVDRFGMVIKSGENQAKIPFNGKLDNDDYVSAIKNLAKTLSFDDEKIKAEIIEFRNSFKSVILASLSKDKSTAIASYSPFIRFDDKFYIYISEIAEHFESIKSNPNAIEVMFLQDEKDASSIILRKRLRYKANAIEISRESAEFKGALDAFLNETNGQGGVKNIAKMADFHLFRLEFKQGRFVKGFGGAYDINADEISAPHTKNPHKF